MERTLSERPVFLVGFMGSGKTTVGRELAAQLGWDFADTDQLVTVSDGRSIDEIFRESGEGAFRRLEWESLEGLHGRRRLIVATGGGLFLGRNPRAWMAARGATIWLDVAFETALRRVGPGSGRPLWGTGNPVDFRGLFEKRRASYALCRFRVAVGDESPVELARRVRQLL